LKTIYLCGAINGCSDSEAKDWRERVKSDLAGMYEFLDPMRRDYRGKEDESVEEIVRGDYADIITSDIILVAADKPSWGTAMECLFAFQQHKHVIVVCGQERVSPWLRKHSTVLVPSLREAISRLHGSTGTVRL
jgi:hypothetical protein